VNGKWAGMSGILRGGEVLRVLPGQFPLVAFSDMARRLKDGGIRT